MARGWAAGLDLGLDFGAANGPWGLRRRMGGAGPPPGVVEGGPEPLGGPAGEALIASTEGV